MKNISRSKWYGVALAILVFFPFSPQVFGSELSSTPSTITSETQQVKVKTADHEKRNSRRNRWRINRSLQNNGLSTQIDSTNEPIITQAISVTLGQMYKDSNHHILSGTIQISDGHKDDQVINASGGGAGGGIIILYPESRPQAPKNHLHRSGLRQALKGYPQGL